MPIESVLEGGMELITYVIWARNLQSLRARLDSTTWKSGRLKKLE